MLDADMTYPARLESWILIGTWECWNRRLRLLGEFRQSPLRDTGYLTSGDPNEANKLAIQYTIQVYDTTVSMLTLQDIAERGKSPIKLAGSVSPQNPSCHCVII